jgi:CBS domain-containing protein
MYQLVIVILDDLRVLPQLLQAWRTIGVSGATILESVGAYRAESWLSRVGLGGLSRMFEAEEVPRRTVMAVVPETLVEQAIAEAERVVGGFDRPHSGILFTVPVGRALGVSKRPWEPAVGPLPPAVEEKWLLHRDTPVERAAAILNLQPTIVPADAPLSEVVREMLKAPNVHVACVVSEEGRLVGLLDLRAVADTLFFHVLPEEFLSEVTDLNRVMEFAERSRIRTAADAMQKPVWVRRGESVKDAFRRMHEHRLSGLPVVDEQYHVVGYINLLELLAVCTAGQGSGVGEEPQP